MRYADGGQWIHWVFLAALACVYSDRGDKEVAHAEGTMSLEIARHGELIASRDRAQTDAVPLDVSMTSPTILDATQDALAEQAAYSIIETQQARGSRSGTGIKAGSSDPETLTIEKPAVVVTDLAPSNPEGENSDTLVAESTGDGSASQDANTNTPKSLQATATHSTPKEVPRTEDLQKPAASETPDTDLEDDDSDKTSSGNLMCCSCWSATYKGGEQWYPQDTRASKSYKPVSCRSGDPEVVCAKGEHAILAWSAEWNEGDKILPKCHSMWQTCHDSTVQGGGWFKQVLDKEAQDNYHSNPFWVEGWYWPSLMKKCLKEKTGAAAVSAFCNQENFQSKRSSHINSYLESSRTCTSPDSPSTQTEVVVDPSTEKEDGEQQQQQQQQQGDQPKTDGDQPTTDGDQEQQSGTKKPWPTSKGSSWGAAPRGYYPDAALWVVLPVALALSSLVMVKPST